MVLLFTCGRSDSDGGTATVLKVRVQAAYHKKIVLQKHGFNGEQTIDLDSGIVQTGLDTFIFNIPAGEERMYTLNVDDGYATVPYINDSKGAELYYNYSTHKYSYKNSPASDILKFFLDSQLALGRKANVLKFKIDSMQRVQPSSPDLKDSLKKFYAMEADFFARYKNFDDTVHSPAAFMAVYDAIIFDNNRETTKKFITNASNRFPNNSVVQALVKSTLDYLKGFEGQYNPGDTLPELVLPDSYGLKFSTYSVRDKFVFINIWSTLCDNCGVYNEQIKKLKQLLPAAKFEVINIAVDNEKQAWLNIIGRNNYNWPQLIDADMWQGAAFKTLKFDSIPSNFLVAPGGRLIKKNIPADSVVLIASRLVK